ncbi:MAG: DNA polymerase III subunit alpha [Gammaproteobacteria bacterium]
MTVDFVHLHVRTEYSIADSVVRVPELIRAARRARMPAVAVTDRSNLFAMVKFYKAAIAQGVKPIIGADLWVEAIGARSGRAPLVLLCQNQQGYSNLTRLITLAYVEGQVDGRPVVRQSWLNPEHTRGLIALSAGPRGGVGQALLEGKTDLAARQLDQQVELFAGDFFVELHRTGRPQEEEYLEQAVRLASKTQCPLLATNDVRFIRAEDFEAHEARVCIQQGYTLDNPERPRGYTEQQYFRDPAEMRQLFEDLPEALTNSVEIAKRCNLSLSLGDNHLPNYDIPDGTSSEKYIERRSRNGLATRLDELSAVGRAVTDTDVYEQRLDRELSVICRMGYPGYFLIVADFMQWARDNDIPVGPGRGSGAGSLVAYVLGITDLDPIDHDLLFERFLNPERVSMPDFDIDFCMEGRDRVIEYVTDRYGKDRVSQIITYGTMGAKAVIRDVGRVLGQPYGFSDRIARLIPIEVGITLRASLEQEAELRELYETDDDVRTTIDLAKQLEGLVRNASTHAGGVVIAPSPLTDFMPLYRAEDDTTAVTQLDKDDVEAIGLVKFDFLGLRTLTIIDRAVRIINAQIRGDAEAPIDIRRIPTDDARTFQLLQSRSTRAVFQLESRGMQDLIRRLRPDHFDDIVALVALFRPGPLQSGMVDTFIERKHAKDADAIDYLHPDLEPVLASTYGVILYQEQVMQIAQRLAGYSLGEADLLRRAMGKKKPEEMAKQRSIFIKGAMANGVSQNSASHIFDLMEKFAGYGFNKSHSAAYAVLSYQTAWLKAHYPAAFMAAVLSSDMDNTDRLEVLKRECDAMNLSVLPPDVNQSVEQFSVETGSEIRYGLAAVKGMGGAAASAICIGRSKDNKYNNLYDFCNKVDHQKLSRRAMEALIKAGALDALGTNRPSLLEALPRAHGQAEQHARAQEAGQDDLFGGSSSIVAVAGIAKIADWSETELLAAERESLGLYLSGHPFDQYLADCPYIASGYITNVAAGESRTNNGSHGPRSSRDVTLAGILTDIRKRGNRVTMFLDDGTGRLEITLFRESYQRFRHLIDGQAVRVVSGTLRHDDFIDDWRLNVRDIEDIDRVIERKASQLVIHWLANGDTDLDAEILQAILEPFRPGQCDVSLYYATPSAEARLQLGADWSVRPSRALRDRLSEAIGVKSFRFIYQNKLAMNS